MATESSAKLLQMRQQLADLQSQIDEEEAKGRGDAIEQIKAIMTAHSLTPEDLGVKHKRGPNKKKSEPKYRDPASGATWSGMGREPSWIKGKKREKFLIA
ncbi:histone family protein nucleoid-structuring protein H-NS [Caballeronia terrestris]|uniref:Histone family protein nucleoid-structuring protein H-NS n=1 Tax=Caballeronia terrestris TaxID=1226301 RepID=A0A158KKR6_9BURK|nr:H-NS histone family protein [Caballeronia terrestris]SAL81727.1 histone family protein nucleoid-structuring protein H-NS [Caballeronia terrestris]